MKVLNKGIDSALKHALKPGYADVKSKRLLFRRIESMTLDVRMSMMMTENKKYRKVNYPPTLRDEWVSRSII